MGEDSLRESSPQWFLNIGILIAALEALSWLKATVGRDVVPIPADAPGCRMPPLRGWMALA